jgi:hypothetical protein
VLYSDKIDSSGDSSHEVESIIVTNPWTAGDQRTNPSTDCAVVLDIPTITTEQRVWLRTAQARDINFLAVCEGFSLILSTRSEPVTIDSSSKAGDSLVDEGCGHNVNYDRCVISERFPVNFFQSSVIKILDVAETCQRCKNGGLCRNGATGVVCTER